MKQTKLAKYDIEAVTLFKTGTYTLRDLASLYDTTHNAIKYRLLKYVDASDCLRIQKKANRYKRKTVIFPKQSRHWNWKGGVVKNNEYLYVLMPEHPHAQKSGHVSKVKTIVENVLGKVIPRKVIVHHIDRNRRNNEHHNLVACEDVVYHRLLHQREKALKATGNPESKKCSFCGEWITPNQHDVFKTKRTRSQGVYERWAHKTCVQKHDNERRGRKNAARRNKRRRLKLESN